MTICMNIYICICMWCIYIYVYIGFPGGSRGIDSTCNNPGAIEEAGWIPGLGRSPGGGSGNPLQYSHLGNPTDRGAWWAIVPSMAKSQTQLKQLSTCTHIHTHVLPYISYIYYYYYKYIICITMNCYNRLKFIFSLPWRLKVQDEDARW